MLLLFFVQCCSFYLLSINKNFISQIVCLPRPSLSTCWIFPIFCLLLFFCFICRFPNRFNNILHIVHTHIVLCVCVSVWQSVYCVGWYLLSMDFYFFNIIIFIVYLSYFCCCFCWIFAQCNNFIIIIKLFLL